MDVVKQLSSSAMLPGRVNKLKIVSLAVVSAPLA